MSEVEAVQEPLDEQLDGGEQVQAKTAAETNWAAGARDLSDINRKRLEKDLIELKKLIAAHFEQRKTDEEELDKLSERITKRKKVREEQQKVRAEREKARAEAAQIDKQRREEEERKKFEEEEAKKKTALQRGDGKEKKKKVLAERRKQLNIDHLNTDKLQEKAMELHKWMVFLEESKYEFECRFEAQKYDLKFMRQRVNDLMGKKSFSKKVNIRK